MVKKYALATIRNRDPILDILKITLPENGLVLEVASGNGEHAAYFAPRLKGLTWQPSEPSPESRASIISWAKEKQSDNLLAPLNLNVMVNPWPIQYADAIVCINLLHISPWAVTKSLMAGATRILRMGGILYIYGPFKIKGKHTSISNQTFHNSLTNRDAKWGIREVDKVILEAKIQGLRHTQRVQMPAHNQSIIFERT